VEPDDFAGFRQAAQKMVTLNDRLADYGTAARQFAEANFQLDQIADRFENILLGQAEQSRAQAAPELSPSER
jgi:glycosyltransferase involved in cell wall biosynthesis